MALRRSRVRISLGPLDQASVLDAFLLPARSSLYACQQCTYFKLIDLRICFHPRGMLSWYKGFPLSAAKHPKGAEGKLSALQTDEVG